MGRSSETPLRLSPCAAALGGPDGPPTQSRPIKTVALAKRSACIGLRPDAHRAFADGGLASRLAKLWDLTAGSSAGAPGATAAASSAAAVSATSAGRVGG